jgi:hypothetical protein
MSFNVDPVAFLTAAAPAQARSAEPSYEAVIKAVEKNLNLDEFASELKFEFSRGGKEPKTWTARLYSWVDNGMSWKVAEFYGSRENGTVLRRQDEQFSQRNGSNPYISLGEEASKAGVFGTDYSFKDVLELTRLSTDYDKIVFEKADLNGRSCFHLVLQAKPGKSPFYYKREMWVDPQTMVPTRVDVFGSTGQKLKTIEVVKTQPFQGINYPVEIMVKSAVRDTETKVSLPNLKSLEKSKTFKYRD